MNIKKAGIIHAAPGKALATAILLAALAASAAFAQTGATNTTESTDSPGLKNAVLLILRHAEKTESGDQLSPDGFKRADAYVNYFKNYQVDGQPLKLDYVYAAADSKNSKRVRLTVEPLCKATGLKLDNRFANKDFQGMVDELRTTGRGHEVLICWHHGQIANMVKSLGGDPEQLLPKGKWPDHVFNWVLELHYDAIGHLIPGQSKRINENLMPGDAESSATADK
jgi:hypothetical protein